MDGAFTTKSNENLKNLIDHDASLNKLIDGFLSGDSEEIESLISIFYRRVYLNCLKITRNPNISEDLTNETFIKALKYKKSYDKQYKFSNWLLKIATNLSIDHLKKVNEEIKKSVYFESLNVTTKNFYELKNSIIENNIEAEVYKKFEREFIKKAVDLLGEIYRIPVILKYYNDLGCEEIAQILNKPVGTIKYRLNRARLFLAKFLKSLVE